MHHVLRARAARIGLRYPGKGVPGSAKMRFRANHQRFGSNPVGHRADTYRCLALLKICLDTYMRRGVYKENGICIRNHCGAEPPRDIEPAGLVPTVGWRDRESARYDATDGVKALASAARGRFRGIHGGRT